MGRKFTLYHSTPSSNVPSILENGIVPRGSNACDDLIDSILDKHNWTRETLGKRRAWMWKYPLGRCMETADSVCVSGDIMYSVQNCRAGLETQDSLTRTMGYLASKYKKRPHQIPVETPPCSVCELEIDEDKPFHKERFSGGSIREVLASVKSRFSTFREEPPSDEEILAMQTCLIYDRIEPENIKSCRPAIAEDKEISDTLEKISGRKP